MASDKKTKMRTQIRFICPNGHAVDANTESMAMIVFDFQAGVARMFCQECGLWHSGIRLTGA